MNFIFRWKIILRCWAPAMQVNYDFHEDLTPAKVDQILDDYAAGRGKDVK